MQRYRDFPVPYDLTAYHGDTFEITFGFKDGDGNYLDTADWTCRMQVRADKNDAVPLINSDDGDVTFTVGVQTTSDGQYNLGILITDTVMSDAALRGLVGWYDLEMTDGSGRRKTILFRRFCVEGDVTR